MVEAVSTTDAGHSTTASVASREASGAGLVAAEAERPLGVPGWRSVAKADGMARGEGAERHSANMSDEPSQPLALASVAWGCGCDAGKESLGLHSVRPPLVGGRRSAEGCAAGTAILQPGARPACS